jgi:hypothetical protein
MALSKDVMGGGFSAGQARALGGNYTTVAATGSVITDAAALTASNVVVTAADGTKGVQLIGNVGDSVTVFNNSGSTLKVWPGSTSEAIAVPGTGLGTAAAAYSHTTYAVVTYSKITSTQWLPNKSA